MIMESLKNYHKPGFNSLSVCQKTKRVITAGADGNIRIFEDSTDTSPLEIAFGEPVNSIFIHDEKFYIGTESSSVYQNSVIDGLQESIPIKFTAAVNFVTMNKDRTRLAACSSDFKAVVSIKSTDSTIDCILKGHTAPVLSMDFDPLDIFIATSSCDGTLRIWKYESSTEEKVISCLQKCSDVDLALSRARVAWEPSSGKFLAVCADKQINVYERTSWSYLRNYTSPKHDVFTDVKWGKNSDTLVGSTKDGYVMVFSYEDRTLLQKLKNPNGSSICSLQWSLEGSKEILYTDSNGFLGKCQLSYTLNKSKTSESKVDALDKDELADLLGDDCGDLDELVRLAEEKQDKEAEDDSIHIDFNNNDAGSDDDDNINSVNLTKLKSKFLGSEDEDNVDKILEKDLDTTTTKASEGKIIYKNLPPLMPQRAFQPGSMPTSFSERFMVWNKYGVVTQIRNNSNGDEPSQNAIHVNFHNVELHHSFTISGTQAELYSFADLTDNALALASSGFEKTEDSEAEPAEIMIRPLMNGESSNSDCYITLPLGELCTNICLVNADPAVDGVFGYLMVATSKNFLRSYIVPGNGSLRQNSFKLKLYQVSPLMLPPISLPGLQIVSMASHPTSPILAVVMADYNVPKMIWRLFYLGRKESFWTQGWQSFPLTPSPLTDKEETFGSENRQRKMIKLKWLGFSDVGNLYSHDTHGVVRRFTSQRGFDFHWTVVGNTRDLLKIKKQKSDCYFIVSLIENPNAIVPTFNRDENLDEIVDQDTNDNCLEKYCKDQLEGVQIQAIYCKSSQWPRVYPRPLVNNLPIKIPLGGLCKNDQTDIEEEVIRCNMSMNLPFLELKEEVKELKIDNYKKDWKAKQKKAMLKLFALSAKMDDDWAALQVANIMETSEDVQLAIRYATKMKKTQLAEKLGAIALQKDETASSSFKRKIRDNSSSSSSGSSSASESEGSSSGSSDEGSDKESAQEDENDVISEMRDTSEEKIQNKSSLMEHSLEKIALDTSEHIALTPMNGSIVKKNPFKNSTNNTPKSMTPSNNNKGSSVFDEWKPSEKPKSIKESAPVSKPQAKTKKPKTTKAKENINPRPSAKKRIQPTLEIEPEPQAKNRKVSEATASKLTSFACPTDE